MDPADRRLAAAAAALARGRAAVLLTLGPSVPATAEASRLAALPREGRLRALAEAVPGSALEWRARALAMAAGERPRIAALLIRLGEGRAADEGVAPWLIRLCRERLSA